MEIRATELYLKWLHSLKDPSSRARVLKRIDRLAHGNPGQFRHLSRGVCELKVDAGAGLRIYYTIRLQTLIVLLAGGTKSSQRADIQAAIELADNL